MRTTKATAITKAALALILILGLVLIAAGVGGMREFEASGYDSENAYTAIYDLSGDLRQGRDEQLTAWFRALPAEARTRTAQSLRRLLSDAWDKLSPGGSAALDAFLSGREDPDADLFDLSRVTWAVTGPKLSSADRKEIAAKTDSEREVWRAGLMDALAEQCAGEDPADDELAQILQRIFCSRDGSGESLPTDHVNAFKKSIRDKTLQPAALRGALEGEITFLRQLINGNSRSVILAGVILALDALFLCGLMAAEKNWAVDFKWILIILIVDFLLYFQMLPLVYLVVKAFSPGGAFSLETFRRLFTYDLNVEALTNTLIAAACTMVLGTLLAFPLAWLVGRTDLYGKKFFRGLFVLTYMVPPYVGAMAWLRLLNPNVGTVNQWLRTLFGLNIATGPLNIYSLPRLIWVLTTFYYPYAFITISRAMEKMDPSLEEASRISGAHPLKTLFTVTLPMMMPSIISGALLVFICAASCYGIPSIIGSPGKVHTVTTRIVEYVSLGGQSLNDATGLSVFLMLVALIILFVSDILLARRQYITVSGKSVRPALVELRKWRLPLTLLVGLFAVIVVVIPFATILLTSFKVDVGKAVTAPGNFTLASWTEIFGRAETMTCLKNSLIFAAVTATVGILVACVMSYLLQRTRVRGRKIPDFLITLGSGSPSVVIALGLIMTMRGDFGVNIYNTAYILIVAYLIKYMMMGMRTVVSAMSQIHVSLEECSQISGASWLRTMLRITGPLIFPSIAAGWFLIFIPSFYELSMTTLLYSSTTKTIGFQLYEYWTFTSQPQSCAMAFGILMIVMLLNFVLNRLTGGEFSI